MFSFGFHNLNLYTLKELLSKKHILFQMATNFLRKEAIIFTLMFRLLILSITH